MMQGAPSHTDTFDLKPGNPFPKSFNPTEYNGLLFPQGLMPQLAGQIDSVALVRAVRAWANVHGLMQQWVQIGRNPAAPTSKISPHIGSVVALELTRKDAILPAFLALNGTPPAASGFLPVADAPFVVTAGGGLPNTTHPDGRDRFATRATPCSRLWRRTPCRGRSGRRPGRDDGVEDAIAIADVQQRCGPHLQPGRGRQGAVRQHRIRQRLRHGAQSVARGYGDALHPDQLWKLGSPRKSVRAVDADGSAVRRGAGRAAGRFENGWPAGPNPDRGAGRIRAHGGSLESQFGARSLPAAGRAVRRGADSRRARHRRHRSSWAPGPSSRNGRASATCAPKTSRRPSTRPWGSTGLRCGRTRASDAATSTCHRRARIFTDLCMSFGNRCGTGLLAYLCVTNVP